MKKLKSIKLGKNDILHTQNMDSMFWQCESLQNVDLSNIHYENVDKINSIFYGCSSLKEIKFNDSEWSMLENDIDMGFADNQKQNVKILVNNTPKNYNEFMTNLARVGLTPNNIYRYIDIKTEVFDSYYSDRVGNYVFWEMSYDQPSIDFEFKSIDNRYTFDDVKIQFSLEMQSSQDYHLWKHNNSYEYSGNNISEGLTNVVNLNINNGLSQKETFAIDAKELHVTERAVGIGYNTTYNWERVFTGNYKVYDVTGFVNRTWQ